MASKKAKAVPKGGEVQFDVPDDVFGDDEDDVVEERDPEEASAQAKDDEPTEPSSPKKKREKEEKQRQVEAQPEEDEATETAPEEEVDAPPLDEPTDAGYLLAQERAKRLELEARLGQVEQRTQEDPAKQEAEEERRLSERKAAARQRATQAQREGDGVALQEAQWELEDIRNEEYRRDSERQVRHLRGREDGAKHQPRQLSDQQAIETESETFRSIHRVTPEEELQMAREWAKLVQKNPEWAKVRRWVALDKTLKLVRGGRGRAVTPGAGSPMVAGGQHTSPSKAPTPSRLPRESREWAARAMGVTLAEYDRVVLGKRGAR